MHLEIAYPSDHVLNFHVDRCSNTSTTAIPANCCTVIPKHFSGRSEFQPTRKIQAIGLARKPWSSGVQPPRCFGQPRNVERLHDAGSSPNQKFVGELLCSIRFLFPTHAFRSTLRVSMDHGEVNASWTELAMMGWAGLENFLSFGDCGCGGSCGYGGCPCGVSSLVVLSGLGHHGWKNMNAPYHIHTSSSHSSSSGSGED